MDEAAPMPPPASRPPSAAVGSKRLRDEPAEVAIEPATEPTEAESSVNEPSDDDGGVNWRFKIWPWEREQVAAHAQQLTRHQWEAAVLAAQIAAGEAPPLPVSDGAVCNLPAGDLHMRCLPWYKIYSPGEPAALALCARLFMPDVRTWRRQTFR